MKVVQLIIWVILLGGLKGLKGPGSNNFCHAWCHASPSPHPHKPEQVARKQRSELRGNNFKTSRIALRAAPDSQTPVQITPQPLELFPLSVILLTHIMCNQINHHEYHTGH
jgi:hypothetical protein